MTVEERVISVVKKGLNDKYEVTLESSLIEDLKIDSFDKLLILGMIEDEFSISIDVEDFTGLDSVKDIVENLKEKFPQIEGD